MTLFILEDCGILKRLIMDNFTLGRSGALEIYIFGWLLLWGWGF